MQTFLSCKVSPGLFSSESAVVAKDHDGLEFSLFVPDEYVHTRVFFNEEDCVTGWLQVDLLDEKDGLLLVRLPAQAFEKGYIVTVSAHDVFIPRSSSLSAL